MAPNDPDPLEFLVQARQRRPGLVRELWRLLRETKKWWLTPVVLALLLLGLFAMLGSSAAAPFIYTLF
jgi:hypothetical protein